MFEYKNEQLVNKENKADVFLYNIKNTVYFIEKIIIKTFILVKMI